MGQGTMLDASYYGLGAFRKIRIWQNVFIQDTLVEEHARLLPTTQPGEAELKRAILSIWSNRPSKKPRDSRHAQYTPFQEPLPYLGTYPYTAPFRVYNETPGRDMLYVSDTTSTL